MAFTLQFGTNAPDFHLPGTDGRTYSLADLSSDYRFSIGNPVAHLFSS
jgi:peroxiredoxin